MTPAKQTGLRNYLPLVAVGKVRELYNIDESKLLFVATDKISGEFCPLYVNPLLLTCL